MSGRRKSQKLLRKLSKDHKTMFENLAINLKNNVLGFSQIHIPYFTGHGVQHAEGIIQQLDSMIPDEVLENMNSIEVFVLLCSAWLHDIGLLKNVDKDERRLSTQEVRDRHHELSRDLIKEKHNELGLTHSRIAEVIAEVSYCHRRRVSIEKEFPSEEETVDTSEVRVRFLAALLRLGDAMDTGSKRAPKVLMGDILELPEKHKRHWRACQLISGIKYAPDRLAIIIDARYKDEGEKKLSLWKFKDLYREFLSIREILIENGLNYGDLIERLFNIITRVKEEKFASQLFKGLPEISWRDFQKMANRWTEITTGAGTIKQKYDRELYVNRDKVEKEFADFLESDKVGFLIIDDTGTGKTNLICSLVEQHRSKNIILLYNCSSLAHLNIERKIIEELSPSPGLSMSTFFDELLDEINEKAEEETSRYFIVFIDAINETDNPKQMLKNINEMIAHINYPRIKIVVSCRTVTWNTLLGFGDFLYRTRFYALGGREEVRLGPFNNHELKEVYELYKNRYRLKTEFKHLSQRAKDVCRVPWVLRFISQTYAEKEIPPYVPLELIFDEYYKKIVESDMQILLGKIVNEMQKLKTDHIARRKLAEDPFIAKCMADSAPSSTYVKLLDRGILTEEKSLGEVRFIYDQFFEFLLAKKILEEPLDEKRSISLLQCASNFGSLWGAIKIAIVTKGDLELVRKLATQDNYDIRQVLIDVFKTLAIQDRNKTFLLMKDILSSDSVASKRLVVLASCEMIPCPADLLVSAMLDKNAEVRGLAIQHSYLLWCRNPKEGAKVVRKISSLGLKDIAMNRRAFLTSLELQARIFLNHSKEKDAVVLVDNLALERLRTLTGKSLLGYIALRLGTRFGKQVVTKLWELEYDLWISPFFEAPQEEREKMRLLIPYLNSEEKLSPKIEKILYEAAGSNLYAVAAMASIILIVQGREHPSSVLFLIQNLLASGDERQMHVGLQALAFASKVAPEMETEFDTAKEIIYSDPQFHKWIRMFGLNICEGKKGKIDFLEGLVKRAIDEDNWKVLERTIIELGNIGALFPENSFLTLEGIFGLDHKPARKALIESLAKIRVLYPDMVDRNLKDEYADLLSEIRRTVVVPPYLEKYGISTFFLDAVVTSPPMRSLAADFIEKFTRIRNEKDFRKLLSYGVKKSVNWWANRENVQAYLEWVEQLS